MCPTDRPCPDELVIAIDSREQRAYPFEGAVVKKLETGDYSLLGLEHEISVERKTKSDAYNSLGGGRARFLRELQRMRSFRYAAIVVESSPEDMLVPPGFSQMRPVAVIRSLIAWSVRFDVHVFFAGGRIHGFAITRNILEDYWRYRREGVFDDG